MPNMPVRPIVAALTMLAATGLGVGAAAAQSSPEAPIRLAQLFGQQRGNESDLIARLGQLENQIRQLTGMVEELQHRNAQLEQQLKRVQQDTDFRFQEMGPTGRAPAQRSQSAPPPAQPSLPPVASRPPAPAVPQDLPPPAATPGRRGDAFDPTATPDAPGAPRPLGTVPSGPGTVEQTPRVPGAPLDLGARPGPGAPVQPLPPGAGNVPPQGQQPVGQQAVLAPSGSAKDEYDLAYGAILRRDYELAVEGFQVFLAHHTSSREPEAQRLVPDAHYWLGEGKFQLKQYNDAAEIFLKISTEYPNALKAPEALLRLGQSLAALGERETACASLGHVLTKYPKATVTVKRAVEQEQKRARC
jgi:tol-pal system protein YbgF